MREWQYFVAIIVAIGAGFGIGYTAGISQPITKDIEWETLLAGATAIIGGGLAYAGAIHPFRRELRRKADNHIHDFKSRCDGFLMFTEPGSEIFEIFFKVFDPRGCRGDEDMISTLARSACETLPSIPEEIVTPELRQQRLIVHRHLGRFDKNDEQGLLKVLPNIQETRQAIFDYCEIASDSF